MVRCKADSRSTSWLLTFSIVLFLIFDVCLLSLNFRITTEVSEGALTINLAGRQRMLTQRMSKAVFQINSRDITSSESQRLIQQFSHTFELFSHTLDAFYYGGQVTDAEHQRVPINRVELPEGRRILLKAKEINQDIAPIHKMIAEQGVTDENLAQLKVVLANDNDELLDLMNQLTVLVEKYSKQKTTTLRTIQLITFVFALLNFAVIVRLFRQVHQQSKDLVNILDELFQSTNVALMVFSEDQRVVMSNQFASHFLGYSARELRHMKRSSLIVEKSNSSDEAKFLTRDGREIEVEVNERIVTHNGNRLSVLTIMDISGHLEKERNDPLTGLQNRHALSLALEVKSEQVRSLGGRFACIFVDLNRFKEINDRYGHKAGDGVLKCFAKRLKQHLRDNDLVFRYGGDEFIVLVDLTSDDASINAIAKKLHTMMEKPINISDTKAVILSLSAGFAIYPDDTKDTDELLNFADQSMYRAKKDKNKEIIHHQS